MKNVLTGQEDNLEVPCEEAVVEIRERYLELNSHAKSYTFKALVQTDPGSPSFSFEVGAAPGLQEEVQWPKGKPRVRKSRGLAGQCLLPCCARRSWI